MPSISKVFCLVVFCLHVRCCYYNRTQPERNQTSANQTTKSGTWNKAFDVKSTATVDFSVSAGKTIKSQMMYIKGHKANGVIRCCVDGFGFGFVCLVVLGGADIQLFDCAVNALELPFKGPLPLYLLC